MSQGAIGTSTIFSNLANADYKFAAMYEGGNIGFATVNGGWSIGAADGEVEWDGDDPSVTSSDSTTRNIIQLRVGDDAGGLGGLICGIGHGGVTLDEGDTIIYTSIKITFTSEGAP